MKQLFYLSWFLLLCIAGMANPVDENAAINMGRAFLLKNNISNTWPGGDPGLTLVYRARAGNNPEGSACFYVFNFNNGKGFVIVAGDDAVAPVLGYSFESSFDPAHIPENTAKWLEGYKKQILLITTQHIAATDDIKAQWQQLRSNNSSQQRPGNTSSVNPLVQTKWDQVPYYNALCPGGSVTGCVATAMAQVMKYWNYPATGTGFHSYNPPDNGYGTLSANFGNTTYQWASMPLQLTGANGAVATLMYHAGVSVDMNYSPQSSGAYVISTQSPVTNCAEYALKTYFGYRNSLQGVERVNYTDAQWIALLKGELDAARPVIYAGFGNGGGHCFVNDGYDNNNFFHFNWGWSGSFDGYFQVNALNPGGVGTGGGAGGYNSGQQAVIGIQPPAATPQSYNIQLYDFVTPSAATIGYGQAFTVSANLNNNGTGAFNGDYCAAVFDNANNFIDYVEIKTGLNLPAGFHYTNNLVFSSTGIFAMLPASYTVSIYFRPTGGNWTAVANSGSLVNNAAISVINPNDIEVSSAITTIPAGAFTEGEPASVNVNIQNDGSTTFTGQYQVNLYNLDGSFAQSIGAVDESTGLASGYTYMAPYLYFNAAAITAPPGTYLLAVLHQPSGGSLQLTGSSYFQNPVKVIVQAAALAPDVFEVNNTAVTASSLAFTFTGNIASAASTGSNCHVSTDVDYYKLVLPAGYNYSINTRLQDSYNSNNGNSYTLDALFTYSTDGVNWSGTFDDVMPGNIILSGGQTVYFKVAPFFVGTTGSYLLDIHLNRSSYSFVWTGSMNTDWNNPGNWSASRLPLASDDITIPAGTAFMPVISNAVNAQCKSLRAGSGVTVTVETGGKLTIAGH